MLIVTLFTVQCSLFISPAKAQETFSIATLNVDGLPGQIWMFNVNQEGPKSAGSERISKYLAAKNCDILCLQENFNYHWEIWSHLFACYKHDEWTGGIILEDEKPDYAHLQNFKFKCDGLNMVWKKDIKSANYERVAWTQNFGKFSHEFDDMITKGFRRHELTLPDGSEVVVYNMHMDASSDRDETKQNDARDRAARLAQWEQLRESILDKLDTRPVIVAGDMNSYYWRDDFKSKFIDAINATKRATAADAWIEKCNGGVYPKLGSDKIGDETLDKILYINPIDGASITPVSVTLDKAGYTYEGKPMGDHYPLFATFSLAKRSATGISSVHKSNSRTTKIHTLQGQHINTPCKGVNIIGTADGTTRKVVVK